MKFKHVYLRESGRIEVSEIDDLTLLCWGTNNLILIKAATKQQKHLIIVCKNKSYHMPYFIRETVTKTDMPFSLLSTNQNKFCSHGSSREVPYVRETRRIKKILLHNRIITRMPI